MELTKYREENVDFTFDWSAMLGEGERIVGSNFHISSPELIGHSMRITSDRETVIHLLSGRPGSTCHVQNVVETSNGRFCSYGISVKIVPEDVEQAQGLEQPQQRAIEPEERDLTLLKGGQKGC